MSKKPLKDLNAEVTEHGVFVDVDALGERLNAALAEADLTEAAKASVQPRDDSDLFDAMFAEAEEDDLGT